MHSLKGAYRLQNGENVLTGLDRPIDSVKYQPNFFGHPASVPVAYTRLALEANVPVIVVSAITKPDGKYYLFASDPITMKKLPDLHQETIRNAEAVLEVAEEIIKKHVDQWSMFYPILAAVITSNTIEIERFMTEQKQKVDPQNMNG